MTIISDITYLLCTLTSLACAVLLLRSYVRVHARLLLWSGLCFASLTLNNALLFVDLAVFTQADLSVARLIPAVIGVALLCYGLIEGETA